MNCMRSIVHRQPSPSTPPATPRAPPSCGASRRWRRWCWRRRWRCSSSQNCCCHVHPAFGFIAAFAEAATIGGLADWYAVVALFKRPLGLPIPHTAIIQSNQHRIADKLGEFIEVHFLEAGPVEAKLQRDRFRLLRRRLAARPQAQRRSRALCAAAVAGGVFGDRKLGPDDLHHPPHDRAAAVDRSGAARRRHAARLRRGGTAPGPARRSPARRARDAEPTRRPWR